MWQPGQLLTALKAQLTQAGHAQNLRQQTDGAPAQPTVPQSAADSSGSGQAARELGRHPRRFNNSRSERLLTVSGMLRKLLQLLRSRRCSCASSAICGSCCRPWHSLRSKHVS